MTNTQPLRIYIDMDGVLADFKSAADELKKKLPMNSDNLKFDEILDFSTFKPMKDAIESVYKIIDMGHDVFIASTPPWNNPDAWGQKRNWIEEHLPELERKIILTHRKDLLIGDILIDDSDYRGQKDFQGTWLHFEPSEGAGWPYMVNKIEVFTNEVGFNPSALRKEWMDSHKTVCK